MLNSVEFSHAATIDASAGERIVETPREQLIFFFFVSFIVCRTAEHYYAFEEMLALIPDMMFIYQMSRILETFIHNSTKVKVIFDIDLYWHT